MRTSTFLLAAASLFDLSIAGYALEDDYMTDFYGGFEFFTDADPTNGNILVHVNRPLANYSQDSSNTSMKLQHDRQTSSMRPLPGPPSGV